MRYVSVKNLKEGMVLGRPLYGETYDPVLSEGLTLDSPQISYINDMGYAGVYISDPQSQDATVWDVVPAALRLATIKASKALFTRAESGELQKSKRKMSVAEQQKIAMPLIEALIENRRRVVDLFDLKPFGDYKYYHEANVVILSLLLGVELGISGNQLYELAMASLLHDMGTIFTPRNILEKPGKLTPEEFDIIKQHAEMGFTFLRDNFEITIEACLGALQHHENYDGSGYPNGLKKNKISIYGRIVAIADAYDAMTSRRPYRDALYPAQAMEYIQAKAGAMFDPELVSAFARIISLYPTGTTVELNSGVRCLVVENYSGSPQRPRLRLLNTLSRTPLYIDLQNDPNYSGVWVNHMLEP